MILNGIANDDSYWKKIKKEENKMKQYISPEFQKEFQEALGKAMEKAGVKSTGITYSSTGNTPGGMWYTCWDGGNKGGYFVTEKDFIPTKIIYNCPATICYFPDGTKEVVKVASDEEYIKEEGVAECIMRKLFKSRHAFLKAVNAGYENLEAEEERDFHNASVERIRENKIFSNIRALKRE